MRPMTGMKLATMACCVVMLVPIGAIVLGGGTVTSMGSAVTAFAPLLLCLGAHLLLFKLMGTSCHGSPKSGAREPHAGPTAEAIPVRTGVPAVGSARNRPTATAAE